MVSGLKSRLSMIAGQGSAQPKPRVRLMEMRVLEHAQLADERLYQLEPLALARIGLDGSWPGIERALFLDTETTGLSRGAGTIAFMVGLGYVRGGTLIVEQHVLGDYPDEPLLISRLSKLAREFDVLVTFNGNAFDLPLLESRAVMCRMPSLFDGHQRLDLMHPSKRLWRNRLGSCRLSALEEQILCSGREDDLPGSEAPARFFKYLETGDMHLLDDVLLHNRLDVLSLASLLIKLCEAYQSPDQQLELPDLYSMGRAMERRGERELAERCYERASRPRAALDAGQLRYERFSAQASLSLSMMRKRAGDDGQAEALWQAMVRRGQMGAKPLVELSKLYEHKRGQPERALDCAQRAMRLETDPKEREKLLRRIQRLQHKIGCGANREEQ